MLVSIFHPLLRERERESGKKREKNVPYLKGEINCAQYMSYTYIYIYL